MSRYYLMSQLPALEGLSEGAPLPITEEAFYELCARWLDEKELKRLRAVSLTPPRGSGSTGSTVLDGWNRSEELLRLALGTVRAANMKKPFDLGDIILPADTLQTARNACAMADPMAAEQYLDRARLEVLGRLRPLDGFCDEALVHYVLQLKLLQRLRRFDADRGQAAYRHIYDSILRGASQESES